MTSTDRRPDDRLQQAATGYRTTLISQGVRLGCKIAGVVILARLVVPHEHGLFAMAASLTFLLTLFRDFGAGAAAIQVPDLTPGQETALCWLYIGLGTALTALTLALAGATAAFYGEPRVQFLLMMMSGNFFLNGLNAWPRTLLARELRFPELNLVESLGAFAGTVAMIVSAARGGGAAAFAWFMLVSEATMLVLAWRFCRWRPRAPADWPALRPLAHTGLRITGFNLLLYGLQQSPVLLMGRLFGAVPVGLYNRSNQLLVQPVVLLAMPFSQVLLATLARLGPRSPDFADHFCETTTTIAHCTLPFAVVSLVLPHEVIWLTLGPNWTEAVPMLRWVALGAAATYPVATLYALGVASGRSTALLQSMAFALPVTLAALWLGATRGPVGMAAGLAVANLLLVVPQLWWVSRGTPVSGRACALAFAGPLGVSLALAAGLWLGRALAGDASMPILLLAGLAGGAVAAAACASFWPRARREWAVLWAHRPFGRSAAAQSAIAP